MATKYIRNEAGGIHSVDEDFLEENIKEDSAGRTGKAAKGTKYLPHGWSEVTEEEAKAAHPQLFGAHDPQIVYNAAERKDYRDRATFEAEEAAKLAADSGTKTK
jgi:hypothetical protein